MSKVLLVILSIIVVSCGGSSSNSNNTNLEDIVATQDGVGVGFKANFESMEGNASWTLELFDDNEVSLGECEFDQRKKTDTKPVYFKNKSADPVCSGVQIDPSSTVNNLKIFNDFKLIKYCLNDNGVKKCGEVRK